MHIITALIAVLPAVSFATPLPAAPQAKISTEAILLMSCEAKGASVSFPCSVDGVCLSPFLRRQILTCPPCAKMETNLMAGYFPNGVQFETTDFSIGSQWNTQPKALATISGPGSSWTVFQDERELAQKEFSAKIDGSAKKGAVAGNAKLDSAEFSCVKDGLTAWNARNEQGWFNFGCIVDYSCTKD